MSGKALNEFIEIYKTYNQLTSRDSFYELTEECQKSVVDTRNNLLNLLAVYLD